MLSASLVTIFRCPSCHDPLALDDSVACPSCGLTVRDEWGIPLLVRDGEAVRRQIDAARDAGRAGWYDDPQSAQLSGPYRHHLAKRRRYVDDVLRRHRRQNDAPLVGLDLGCGDGENLAWLAGHVDRLLASDYNLGRLRRAQAKRVATVFFADATDYPMLDESVDVVFCNHVLEHIPDDGAALAEIARILRPSGLVVLGVPNEGAGFWRLAYRLEPRLMRRTDHVNFYTAASVAARCGQAGFEVRHIEPIGWGLPHWTLDSLVRRFESVDDAFERLGRRWFSSQATSLYLLLAKR